MFYQVVYLSKHTQCQMAMIIFKSPILQVFFCFYDNVFIVARLTRKLIVTVVALSYVGEFLMFYGKQFLNVKCFHCTKAWGQKMSNPSFRPLFISMVIATLRDYIWKKVETRTLEQQQT